MDAGNTLHDLPLKKEVGVLAIFIEALDTKDNVLQIFFSFRRLFGAPGHHFGYLFTYLSEPG